MTPHHLKHQLADRSVEPEMIMSAGYKPVDDGAPTWGEMQDDSCPFDTILARTPYFVLPKLAIQAMPLQWRQRFAALLQETEDAGLETPSYHVIRDDSAMTLVERSDSEDDYSPIESISVVRRDPWADYRRGDIRALCPSFKL